jgi:hypothetical protein
MNPSLVKILLVNMESSVEAIKMAALRSIEFLIDQLGCSLEIYLVHIIASVIRQYPRSST